MRLLALVAVAIILAGCLSRAPPPSEPTTPTEPPVATGPDSVHIRCRVKDEAGRPLAGAFCTFQFGEEKWLRTANAEGEAGVNVTKGLNGTVLAHVAGRVDAKVSISADRPKAVDFVLRPRSGGAPKPSEAPTTPTAPSPPPGNGTPPPPPQFRAWQDPVKVTESGTEPHLTVARDGTIYYAPTSTLFRSENGGKSFSNIEPPLTAALPTLASDTSVHVAPDGSVWFSRYWGYADATLGCTSTTKGNSWTCDNGAIPGATDRMWIVGLDSQRGYLQTNEGLYHHVWAYTQTGSTKYTPHATTTTTFAVRNGNMVYDEKNDAVWQVEWVGGTQRLLRVDGNPGLVPSRNTGVPATYALPSLAVFDGVLWTTGERDNTVIAARSVDQGATWTQFPLPQTAASATFSAIAAGPQGRVAVIYYGSDKPGPSTNNGGTWSVYVSETDNGWDEDPIWVESLVQENVHKGNLCIGLNCEQSGNDPQARYSGDLIGIAVDPQGNAHLAYVMSGPTRSMYQRQA